MINSQKMGTDIKLLCFGYGYCASYLSKIINKPHHVSATAQSAQKYEALRDNGISPIMMDDHDALSHAINNATHVLISVPPSAEGDPIFNDFGHDIAAAPNLKWIGYLSTTGVYGDTGGAAIDETAPLNPASERAQWRVKAEGQWQSLKLPTHIFRLSGIYGPGRNVIERIKAGTARYIEKKNHVFNRIHVEDIAQILLASMHASTIAGDIYNLADNMPTSAHEITRYAYELLGETPPPLVQYEDTKDTLSPMAQSFYADHKIIKNDKVKKALGIKLIHPDYQAGLRAIHNTMINHADGNDEALHRAP